MAVISSASQLKNGKAMPHAKAAENVGGTAVPAVVRAMGILGYVASKAEGASFPQIHQELNIPKSSCYLLIETLSTLGALERDEAGAYRIGAHLYELGCAYRRGNDLFELFSQTARQLVDATQETVQCSILSGSDIVYVAKRDGLHPVRLVSQLGSRLPAHATAPGKVLLSQKLDERLHELLPPEPFLALSTHTVETFSELRGQLEEIRKVGYAVEREEVLEGLCCVAAPIQDASGEVVASLSLSLPTQRLDAIGEKVVAKLVMGTCNEISAGLGYGRPVFSHTALQRNAAQ